MSEVKRSGDCIGIYKDGMVAIVMKETPASTRRFG